MTVEIASTPFDPWARLREYQDAHPEQAGRYGATAVFVGTLRDFNDGDPVRGMYLEHYPGMTERFLEELVEDARRRWDLLDVLIVHRVGELRPDDAIVLVAVWTAHRKASFEACRHLMEALKSRAPFWKKETLADGGTRWVERNTPG